MLTPITITTRDILRNYKTIFDQVQKTKQPAIVITKKQPQVAIIPLEDLKKLTDLKYQNSAKNLLIVAEKVQKLLKNEKLPADLSEKHDFYLWEDET